MTRPAKRPSPPPPQLYLEDHIAYELCMVANRGHCPCFSGKIRACESMEIVARRVLARIDLNRDVPRRARRFAEGLL